MGSDTILKVKNLKKTYYRSSLFHSAKNDIHALHPISFGINAGETLGIVGESGSGKTTVARIICGLEPATEGSVELLGKSMKYWMKNDTRKFRSTIQYLFQDPIMSLNPRKTIFQIIEKPLKNLTPLNIKDRKDRIAEMLELVALRPEFINRYPHELSGGQCQRIGIARALVTRPKILALDEPVSALDVSVQAQILNLLLDLKKQLDLTYIFISHDLSVVKFISDRILVMKQGNVVEDGCSDDIFNSPKEEYTRKLIDSIPQLEGSKK